MIPKFCRHPLDLGHVYREAVARAGTRWCATRDDGRRCAPRWATTSPGRPARGSRCVRTTRGACSNTSSLNTAEVWSWCKTIANNREWAAKWNRTRPGTPRGPAPDAGLGPTPPLVNLNLDKARLNAAYNMDDADERKIGTRRTVRRHRAARAELPLPRRRLGVYITVRNSVLCRWRANPNAYVSVEQACLVHARAVYRALPHRFSPCGIINFESASPGIPAPGEPERSWSSAPVAGPGRRDICSPVKRGRRGPHRGGRCGRAPRVDPIRTTRVAGARCSVLTGTATHRGDAADAAALKIRASAAVPGGRRPLTRIRTRGCFEFETA